MPTPPNVRRVVIKGSLPGGESMQHTFHVKEVAPIGDGGRNATQTLASGVATAWDRFITVSTPSLTSTASILAQNTVYSLVTAYDIDEATGRASEAAEAPLSAAAKGTSTAAALPTEVACCATLLTGKPGRSNRGRMFLGGFTIAALANDGRVLPSTRLHLATALARFFDEVQAIDDAGPEANLFDPVIASFTTGTSNLIRTVSVGDVWDVQRSRRSNLIEQRSAVSFS